MGQPTGWRIQHGPRLVDRLLIRPVTRQLDLTGWALLLRRSPGVAACSGSSSTRPAGCSSVDGVFQ